MFDGSCRLIPIKLVADECVDLANDFIPELIDTLASQMNPQVVCATAGLCNSVAVDRLLREYKVWKPRRIIGAVGGMAEYNCLHIMNMELFMWYREGAYNVEDVI